jgi:hypothetical protein
MKKSCCPAYLAALLIGMGSAAPVLAQGRFDESNPEDKFSRSHLLDLFPVPASGDPSELLAQRLQGRNNQKLADQLRSLGIGPKVLEELKERLKNDDQLKKALKDFKPDNPLIPPKFRETLNQLNQLDSAGKSALESKLKPELLDDLKERLQVQKNRSAEVEPKTADKDVPGTAPTQSPPSGPEGGPAAGRPATRPSSEESSGTSQMESPLAKGLLGLANRLERLNPGLSNSPALRDAVRELGRHIGEPDQRWQQLGKSVNALEERWTNVSDALHLERVWPKGGFHWPEHWETGALPRIHLGEARRLAAHAPGGGDSTGGPPQGLLMLLGLAAAVWAGWKLLGRWQFGRRETADRDWELGPWPVDPALVGTRGELVQAFEYLSLLILGPGARSQNHRMLAAKLGLESTMPVGDAGQSPPAIAFHNPGERRLVAQDLASIYEFARYTPPADTLSEEALARARRDLCRFAGVSPS